MVGSPAGEGLSLMSLLQAPSKKAGKKAAIAPKKAAGKASFAKVRDCHTSAAHTQMHTLHRLTGRKASRRSKLASRI